MWQFGNAVVWKFLRARMIRVICVCLHLANAANYATCELTGIPRVQQGRDQTTTLFSFGGLVVPVVRGLYLMNIF